MGGIKIGYGLIGIVRGVLQGTALKINRNEKFSEAFSPEPVGQ